MTKIVKKLHDQRGVGMTAIALVVVVALVVVGVAYMGYHNTHKAAAHSIIGD